MQRVNNFGSLLQSYSLKKILEELGHRVSFIDIKPNDDDRMLMEGYFETFSSESEKTNVVLNKLKKIDRYALNRIHIKILNSSQDIKFKEFQHRVLKLSEKSNNEKYDLCIIGSDEVFNCNTVSPWGFTSQLFGNVKQAERIITYAASCGSTKYENVPKKALKKIKDTLKNVSAFSVRDKNTFKFLKNFTDDDININLDPVLIGDFSKEIEHAEKNLKLPEKYCIVYSYYNRINNADEINSIKNFCKKHGFKIVTIGAPQMWVKNHMVLTPFEVLATFKNADFVYTDTFHGTIFSAKYSKKFAVMARNSNANKLLDLVERLNLNNYLISEDNDIEKIYAINKNEEEIETISIQAKDNALNYLNTYINEEK